MRPLAAKSARVETCQLVARMRDAGHDVPRPQQDIHLDQSGAVNLQIARQAKTKTLARLVETLAGMRKKLFGPGQHARQLRQVPLAVGKALVEAIARAPSQ